MADPLARFAPATQAWFRASFAAPTPVQVHTWEAVAGGGHVLVSAPTGSGKTLAAFLSAVDRLGAQPGGAPGRTRVLYVSPLKALAYDVDRNLRAPLTGIRRAAERLGTALADIAVGVRTGDTSAEGRRRLVREPPDILITTPESLYLLLTSQARALLEAIDTVIVDEVHAVAATKRGAHLALSLERLHALTGGGFQRIGLSATQRPLSEVAQFLAGGSIDAPHGWVPRPVTVVEVPGSSDLDVEIVVPVQDMGAPSTADTTGSGANARSVWPAVHPRILELVRAHRSTIVFCNSRRLAERLCERLNELACDDSDEAGGGEPIARTHHGSMSREQRVQVEEALKAGRLRCVVATSSLELGIDMGSVDLVVQVESPGSVAAGVQRIGRAGHHVGAPSVGKVFPKYRADLLECVVVVRRMRAGAIEATAYPRNPLDVLAQQIVAMVAMDAWDVPALHRVVQGAASFADLSRAQLDAVLDMLSGRYPSDAFAELRPRLNWDRVADRLTPRPGAQRLAVTSGGTIPDRGLYGVFLVGDGNQRRVGELDEEMVYETRPGETITLGASTWRIEDITRDQVLVSPAPGEPGKLPFWHGDAPGRPVEVGRALGEFVREISALPADEAHARLTADGLDEWAAGNVVRYLADQREATGTVPSDQTIVVERFRDEIGDWRICVLSPFGARVHAPWALAIQARARERLGQDVQVLHGDDGIVVRLPDTDAWADGGWPSRARGGAAAPSERQVRDLDSDLDAVLIDPDDVDDLVVGELSNSALFAARFRECAARALLLPRRVGGAGGARRTPLWQQRQRAADLLAVASRYPSFPIVLETYRECLRDVFDVPALREVLAAVAARRIRVAPVDTPAASPFAASLLFEYVASYMYEGDAPLAERRARALSLDRQLLAELLGSEELRELIDADALVELELELQRVVPARRARDVDGLHDLLREVGDLTEQEVQARTDGPAASWLAELAGARRACLLPVAGEQRWVAAEDVARFRDALGIPPPPGLPAAFLEPVDRPLVDLVARYARTHGPFVTADVATRMALPHDAVELALKELDRDGRVTGGAFRPGGTRREWCDVDVLRRLRRRSLAALRRDVEPVDQRALARFLPGWHGIGARGRGVDRTLEVVEQLQGLPVVASVLEPGILAARVEQYEPAWLDELCASGEVVWIGRGPLGSGDGRIALYLREQLPLLGPLPRGGASRSGDDGSPPDSPVHEAVLAHLASHGASFWPPLAAAAAGAGEGVAAAGAFDALWDLVWAGLVTNDTLGPVRAVTGMRARRGQTARRSGRRRPGRGGATGGPPGTGGRWSLVEPLLQAVAPTERAAAVAAQLLERHGVLVRDALAIEDITGGYSSVYPVLSALEEAGRARRGYFVEGLGGAQFALPGALDRLRERDDAEQGQVLVLAATDPANPFGAVLPWPRASGQEAVSPKRVAGAHVVLVDGALLVYLEKGARSIVSFTDDPHLLAAAASALAGLADSGRVGRLQVQRIDGAPAADQPLVAHLRAAGFADHPRGLVRR